MERLRCTGRNRRGAPCGMAPVTGSPYCFAHSPERARERAEAREHGGRHRQSGSGTMVSAEPVQLRDLASLQTLLENAVSDTLQQENSAQRSRTIGYLAGIALRALEVGELEERLAALEARHGHRTPRRIA